MITKGVLERANVKEEDFILLKVDKLIDIKKITKSIYLEHFLIKNFYNEYIHTNTYIVYQVCDNDFINSNNDLLFCFIQDDLISIPKEYFRFISKLGNNNYGMDVILNLEKNFNIYQVENLNNLYVGHEAGHDKLDLEKGHMLVEYINYESDYLKTSKDIKELNEDNCILPFDNFFYINVRTENLKYIGTHLNKNIPLINDIKDDKKKIESRIR